LKRCVTNEDLVLKHCAVIATVALLAAPPVIAQSHPDFTGTWTVEKVEMPERPQGGMRGGGTGGGRGGYGGGGMRGGMGGGGMHGGGQGRPQGQGQAGGMRGGFARLHQGDKVRVKQTADRLTVTFPTEDGEQMNTYALDGSESSNIAGEATVKSKTKWEGVALVTDSSRKIEGPQGEVTLKTHEVRSLSDDKNTMTVVTTIDTPRGKMTATTTFTREDSR
jgi:hypothetical protein